MAITVKKESLYRDALLACLRRIPSATVEATDDEGPGQRADLRVQVGLPGGASRALICEFKDSGQPRWARQAINQLWAYRDDPNTYCVFMAPYISPKAAELCAREGVGFIDLAGNCRLSFDGIYIEQEGRPNPDPQRRELRSLFSPKATRVLRVLLSKPSKKWKTQPLADEADVSLGQVSNLKKRLLDREWIETSREGLFLKEPEALLLEWAENYDPSRNRPRAYYSLKSSAEIESDIAEQCDRAGLRYALTAFSGAARLAPAVRYQRASAFVESAEKIASSLDLKEVESGANVSLLTPYDDGVFYDSQEIDGVRVASPVQRYLDLASIKGRGEEAARAVLDLELRTRW